MAWTSLPGGWRARWLTGQADWVSRGLWAPRGGALVLIRSSADRIIALRRGGARRARATGRGARFLAAWRGCLLESRLHWRSHVAAGGARRQAQEERR